MSEYWKSTKKHHCAICNIWLPAHPRSIATHNASEIHTTRKDIALARLERAAAEKAVEQRALTSTLQAIEAAAMQAMKQQINGEHNSQGSSGLTAAQVARQIATEPPTGRVGPPPLSHADKQLEMQRLEAFITEKASLRAAANTAVESVTLAPPLLESYYGKYEEIPELIRQDPRAKIRANWTEQIHETTGLPIWHFPPRNLYLWSEPVFSDQQPATGNSVQLATQVKAEVEESAKLEAKVDVAEPKVEERAEIFLAADNLVAKVKKEEAEPGAVPEEASDLSLEAIIQQALSKSHHGPLESGGVPGQWSEVAVGDEIGSRDAVFAKADAETENSDKSRGYQRLIKMEELLADSEAGPKGDARGMVSVLEEVDATRVARASLAPPKASEGSGRVGFKKRKLGGAPPAEGAG